MARNFPRGRRSGRETRWLALPETRTVLASANSQAIILSLTTAEKALRPFTITRTIIHRSITSDQQGAGEVYAAACGIAVVSDQASSIGVTAVPTPFDNLDSDLWLFHDILDGEFVFVSGVGIQEGATSPRGGHTVESKAMRKVEDGQDVVVVIENDGLSAGSVNYVAGRMLIKLH